MPMLDENGVEHPSLSDETSEKGFLHIADCAYCKDRFKFTKDILEMARECKDWVARGRP